VTRLRLDAALYEPAPERRPKQTGRPRKKGRRLPTLPQVAHDRVRRTTGRRAGSPSRCEAGRENASASL